MKVLYVLLIVVLLTSCGPSAEQMTATSEAARAQTETAAPTLTFTPTLTPTHTSTPTQTPTNTPSPTPSSTSTPDVTATATAKPAKSKGGLPGESIADSILQKDILNVITLFESALGCSNFKVINTFLVTQASQGKWSERWIIDRCGTEGSYLINFTTVSTGGTNYSISIEK